MAPPTSNQSLRSFLAYSVTDAASDRAPVNLEEYRRSRGLESGAELLVWRQSILLFILDIAYAHISWHRMDCAGAEIEPQVNQLYSEQKLSRAALCLARDLQLSDANVWNPW